MNMEICKADTFRWDFELVQTRNIRNILRMASMQSVFFIQPKVKDFVQHFYVVDNLRNKTKTRDGSI